MKLNPDLKPGQQRKSGTSFATPIAAALAAVVLDYARHYAELEEEKFYVSQLKLRQILLEVFGLMAWKRNNYLYLDREVFKNDKIDIYASILDISKSV